MIARLRGAGGAEVAAGFEPIRIFRDTDGLLKTLDNRRLLIFSHAEVGVPYVWATSLEIAKAQARGKFSVTPAQQGGWFIEVRKGKLD